MEKRAIPNHTEVHSTIEHTGQTAGYEGLAKKNEVGDYELSILVNGVYCAACIQKIESALQNEQPITHARLNFSTRRLSFSWNGPPEFANQYITMIEELGYGAQPYDAEAEQSELQTEERFLLLCLGVAGFAMGNVMLLSVGLWVTTAETMGMATRDFIHWIAAFIALPTIMFSGRPFFRSAYKALKGGHTNMDVPISLAITLAGVMSLFETMNHGEHVYFDSAVMLIFFLLVGRYLDFRARKNARSTATDLLSTLNGFASVMQDGKIQRMLVRDLREGMRLRISSGDKFPVDGLVEEGEGEVDTSLVTGETVPRDISKGCEVFAGTLNLGAPVIVKVSKPAEDSLLSDIVRLMEKAGQGQAEYVRLADRAAKLYTPVVHTFAALAFLGWVFIGGMAWQGALMIAVTVLIITCPCALGLAVPVVQVLASGRLMKNGVLVKSGDALERLAVIDTILLDKTGTLTTGNPTLSGAYDPDILQQAASLAAHSTHPLSKAMSASYDGKLITLHDVEEQAGQGMQARLENRKAIRLGSRRWCGDHKAEPSGKIELWLHIEGEKPVPFYFTDHLRHDTVQTISRFKASGITPILLSGDRAEIVEQVAQEVGIEVRYAEQTPPQKFEILEQLKAKGHKVLMVGDGLNDAPSLAGADVSIAPGTAIDMAQNAADIVFMGEKFSPVFEAHKTAQMTQRLVKQNFALAIGYNIIAIPMALAGMVTPFIAALAMSGSSLIVIANSFRLKIEGKKGE